MSQRHAPPVFDIRVEEHQLLASIEVDEVSVLVAAPIDVDRDELAEAIDRVPGPVVEYAWRKADTDEMEISNGKRALEELADGGVVAPPGHGPLEEFERHGSYDHLLINDRSIYVQDRNGQPYALEIVDPETVRRGPVNPERVKEWRENASVIVEDVGGPDRSDQLEQLIDLHESIDWTDVPNISTKEAATWTFRLIEALEAVEGGEA